jgi:hypothetical protein
VRCSDVEREPLFFGRLNLNIVMMK